MNPSIFHVRFVSSNQSLGEGLVVFKEGKINGGDHGYLFLGSYETNGSEIGAKIKVKRWNPAVKSVLGDLTEFEVDLKGTLAADANSFTATGSSPQMRNTSLTVTGRRLADAV